MIMGPLKRAVRGVPSVLLSEDFYRYRIRDLGDPYKTLYHSILVPTTILIPTISGLETCSSTRT